jgi:large subunit ribosomal protein L9|nr:MAG: 50S ribosomal protein L9 [Bacteroidota bacterium]
MGLMRVILTQDVEKLGKAGDVVRVRGGYGRNYLIPRGLALVATPGNLKRAEEIRRRQLQREARNRQEAMELAARLADVVVTIPARVGEENRIFGTVTNQQLAEALAEKGFQIDRRKIELPDEIRTLGQYQATIRLYQDITATVTVWVVRAGEEEG